MALPEARIAKVLYDEGRLVAYMMHVLKDPDRTAGEKSIRWGVGELRKGVDELEACLEIEDGSPV